MKLEIHFYMAILLEKLALTYYFRVYIQYIVGMG